jgi:hypothetical protein
MLKRVVDSPWFQFVRSLFDNIFVFQFASTLLMTASTVFSIRLLSMMLKRVIDSPWFQFVRSLFDNIFVFHQFASTLLMTVSTVFSIRLLFNNVVVLRFISTLLETAISNVDCTFVEMECSFDEQFQFFLEVCASCRTAKWKGESIMLKCD